MGIHFKTKTKNSNSFFAVGRKKYLDKLDKIDWAFIATPDNFHYKIVKKLLILKRMFFAKNHSR